jgi:hypothetical protein
MLVTLRWEVCALFEAWAAPHSTLLGSPIASGSIVRDDGNGATPPDGFFAPSDPILFPAAIEGARHYTLALEVFGARGWIVSFGTPDALPQAGDGLEHAEDPYPCVLVPAGGLYGSNRSREIRAVRPGGLFIAQPSRA